MLVVTFLPDDDLWVNYLDLLPPSPSTPKNNAGQDTRP